VAEYPDEERNRDVSKPPGIKTGDFDTIFTVKSCYKMLFLECENHSITFRNVSQVAEYPDEERNRDVSKPPGITQSPLGTFSQVAEYPDEERNRDVSKPPAIKTGDFDTIFTVEELL
jgi:hypothetical protein